MTFLRQPGGPFLFLSSELAPEGSSRHLEGVARGFGGSARGAFCMPNAAFCMPNAAFCMPNATFYMPKATPVSLAFGNIFNQATRPLLFMGGLVYNRVKRIAVCRKLKLMRSSFSLWWGKDGLRGKSLSGR
jgi:hypothetical protein